MNEIVMNVACNLYLLLFAWLLICSIDTTIAHNANVNWYYENWCGGELQYLDDRYCAKIFPEMASGDYREWKCPVALNTAPAAGFVLDGTPLNEVPVDTATLAEIADANSDTDVNLCFIITQRVLNATEVSGVSIYNKYLCAGNHSAEEVYETWSSSKVFAAANAAGRLRTNETTCASKVFGLDSTVTGKDGVTPIGDLATIIASYDETAGYSSNALSSYMHDLGFRDRIYQLATNKLWLGLPDQSLGGNYGEATPSDLSFDLTKALLGAEDTCAADQDPWPTVYSNSLSALAAAEMVRRLAMHREVSHLFQFPGVMWRDIQEILYGAEESLLFPGLQWGGMMADTAIFMQTALNLPKLLEDWGISVNAPDQWRIFSKLGAGYSSSRYRGEIVSNGYVCLPNYADEAVTGLELTFASRASSPDDPTLYKAQEALMEAMRNAMQLIQ